MNAFLTRLMLTAGLALATTAFVGCDSDTPAENAVENTRDAVDDAADGTQDALDDAGDAMKDAADDAGDALKDATN